MYKCDFFSQAGLAVQQPDYPGPSDYLILALITMIVCGILNLTSLFMGMPAVIFAALVCCVCARACVTVCVGMCDVCILRVCLVHHVFVLKDFDSSIVVDTQQFKSTCNSTFADLLNTEQPSAHSLQQLQGCQEELRHSHWSDHC